ncbi:MAG: S-methyl-5-thioribose-1-phosphate isomerase [Candidatus Altiarchaeota archaeon]
MPVKETAEKIGSMQIRGALRIAIAAAKALEQEIVEGASYDELVKAGDALKDARPTAVLLPNAINYILHLAESHATDDPIVARPMLIGDVANFIAELESSIDRIAEVGAEIVDDGDVVLTICNSDTVARILKRAWQDGKRFKVYACETRPRLQGHITVKDLSSASIDVTIIVDSAAYYTMLRKGVRKAMVGADTVSANGDVVNKIGTSQVALAAKAAGIEFIVCTETIKFSPYSIGGHEIEIEERDPKEVAEIPKVGVFNPAFDVTRADMIARIVTEEGIIRPADVERKIEEKYAWMLK